MITVREIDRETTPSLLCQQKADQDLGWLNWINALKREEGMKERGPKGGGVNERSKTQGSWGMGGLLGTTVQGAQLAYGEKRGSAPDPYNAAVLIDLIPLKAGHHHHHLLARRDCRPKLRKLTYWLTAPVAAPRTFFFS